MDKQQFAIYARFNKFSLPEAEAAALQEEIDWELNQLLPLTQLDTGDAQPMVHAVPMRQMFREDRAEQTISREQLLNCAPEVRDGAYVTPRVAD